MSEPSTVLRERRGEVVVVSLNRPERRNAIDRAMVEALHGILDDLETSDTRAVVLTAVGETFASGADIADADPLAIRPTKLGLGLQSSAEAEQGARFEIVAQAVTFESEEKRRRMTEFLERKKPRTG